jgi:uncharacterized membrane protein YoaK (UPF0700 family)
MAVAAVLSAVAGIVDAICFDRVFAVFPANQSGNAILLGVALGSAEAGEAWRPALAICGFVLGVAAAIVLGSRISRQRRPELLLTIEVVLLVPVAIAVLATPDPQDELGGPVTAGLLLLATAAMGIQTEIVGRVAGTAVATTYQSGAIVRIAELASRVALWRRSPIAPTRAAPGLTVLGIVLVSYVGGAALGAALGAWKASLFVPVAVLVAVTALVAVTGEALAPVPGTTPQHGSS